MTKYIGADKGIPEGIQTQIRTVYSNYVQKSQMNKEKDFLLKFRLQLPIESSFYQKELTNVFKVRSCF